LISAYFTHHTINGRHGLEARGKLMDRSSRLEREIAALDAVRARLQREVSLLRTEPPHPDMVEEVAIGTLGMANPQDLIITRSGLRGGAHSGNAASAR
jgi:cell division protein FtsB